MPVQSPSRQTPGPGAAPVPMLARRPPPPPPAPRCAPGGPAPSRPLCRTRCVQQARAAGPDRHDKPGHLFLGVDFGTSGSRAVVVDGDANEVSTCKRQFQDLDAHDWPATWERSLFDLIRDLPQPVRESIAAVAIDGTSATTICLSRKSLKPLAPAKLYNESQPKRSVERAKSLAPPADTVIASTSAFCKVLTWEDEGLFQAALAAQDEPMVLHQADWLAALLHGHLGLSDWNNALKLGFNPATERYPDYILSQRFSEWLPQRVVSPGTPIDELTADASHKTGLPSECIVCAGTTDSIASTLAAGIAAPGHAVTTLGSTLVIKLMSHERVDNADLGLYSHRLGDMWLVGGASNTGGAVLRKFFSNEDLVRLSQAIDPSKPTGLGFYPLVKPGERFPVNDPDLPPRMEPRPQDDHIFLQALLEGMADIEAQAYAALRRFGATDLTQVLTAGGGAKNPVWTRMRADRLGVPVLAANHGEAAYGAALLARKGYDEYQTSGTAIQRLRL